MARTLFALQLRPGTPGVVAGDDQGISGPQPVAQQFRWVKTAVESVAALECAAGVAEAVERWFRADLQKQYV
jgi:hypothetical protein